MWPDIAAWFQSPGGARVLQTSIVPALSIVAAGVVAALIARAALRSALRRADREQAATAVAGLVEAARAVSGADGGRDRRRAARLRTEADVRVRLLPLPGAVRAADWAAAATDAAGAAHADGRRVVDLAPLRDPLIAWVKRPGRARRLFARPADLVLVEGAGAQQDETASAAVPGPLRTPPPDDAADGPAEQEQERESTEVPAWRRTRSAERLQQEHAARDDVETVAEGTAPVTVAHAHRADAPAVAAAATATATAQEAPAGAPGASRRAATAVVADDDETAAGRRSPEWLDTYDDEADVTQNLDLRTPPPVAAAALRDRTPATGIVPRP